MLCDLPFIRDIANLSLTFILSVATVFLAIYTYKLVNESRKSRKAQIQPYLSIHLEVAETDPTLQFIIIQNIGQGTAYDLTFDIQKDIGDYGYQANKISDRGLFKEGMRFCPSGFSRKYFLLETQNSHDKKTEEEVILEAKYKNVFGESFAETFHIRVKENSMASKITPSETHIGRIAESLQEIARTLSKIK